MNKFDRLLQEVPEKNRHLVNAFATDRDGTLRAFYTRDPRPVYQHWKSDSTSLIIRQTSPMLDDWNHSLVQRPESHSEYSWASVVFWIGAGCSALVALIWAGINHGAL
jgi:hypothetical protein